MAKLMKIEDGRDVTRLLKHNHCPIRNGKGTHRVGILPNGRTLVYYEHGEFPKGMLHHILKVLKLAGLLVFLLVVAYVYMFGV